MSRAEDLAEKAYPKREYVIYGPLPCEEPSVIDDNKPYRIGFIEGYHQAEFDLQLTWEDIADILDVTDVIANDDSMEVRLKTMSEEEYCQEVLKRFKKQRNENTD